VPALTAQWNMVDGGDCPGKYVRGEKCPVEMFYTTLFWSMQDDTVRLGGLQVARCECFVSSSC